MGPRRIGVLGGSFDPIHAGHLDLAHACLGALRLDEVRFVTNRRAPHKPAPVAAASHRHAMVALATAGDPGAIADPREIERGEGPSFTVDTLESLREGFPGCELFFLAGSDSLAELTSWRRFERVLELATFVAVSRSGHAGAAPALPSGLAGRVVEVDHEPPPFSSRELRARLAAGSAPPDALARSVLEYVGKHGLYGYRARPIVRG